MIFSDGPHNVAGYSPKFILLASAIDYMFFVFDEGFLTLQIGGLVANLLPSWLAFLTYVILAMACVFLAIFGPMVLIYVIVTGWKHLADD